MDCCEAKAAIGRKSSRAALQNVRDVLCARCEYGVGERLRSGEGSALRRFGGGIGDEGRDGRDDPLRFRQHSPRLLDVVARHEGEGTGEHVGGEELHASADDGGVGSELRGRICWRNDVDGEEGR